MLTFVQPPQKDPNEPPLPIGRKDPFDWSERLSIEIIRQHTKTDDVAGVSDEMLEIYRQTAVEAAQQYTGALLTGQLVVTEAIQGPSRLKLGKLTYKHRLQYPVTRI